MHKFQTLDFAKPFYCLTPFKFNGQSYKLGDLFDWRKIACSQRQVAQLWQARKLRHIVATLEAPAVTGIPATLEATGAGWYNVAVDGLGVVNPSKLKGKAAAEQWATENGYSLLTE